MTAICVLESGVGREKSLGKYVGGQLGFKLTNIVLLLQSIFELHVVNKVSVMTGCFPEWNQR